MIVMRAWILPICIVCGVALLLPLVAPVGPVAIGLSLLGCTGLVWLATRRRPAARR